ncbi:hypothetical protein Q8A67_019632 [Cirrhinus molitorella]|uniref:Uncharacterized protein n=1 Tax=Cirrhinus molitorella TaxID=172907 RepID=A0AA88PCS5_9TELE|nr:hypothetical protein Q8A67_019632 [Cirrhinus molitorella]
MHPVSTLRAANDGGESNCESDGGRGTLGSCRPIKQDLNAWTSDFFNHPMLFAFLTPSFRYKKRFILKNKLTFTGHVASAAQTCNKFQRFLYDAPEET